MGSACRPPSPTSGATSTRCSPPAYSPGPGRSHSPKKLTSPRPTKRLATYQLAPRSEMGRASSLLAARAAASGRGHRTRWCASKVAVAQAIQKVAGWTAQRAIDRPRASVVRRARRGVDRQAGTASRVKAGRGPGAHFHHRRGADGMLTRRHADNPFDRDWSPKVLISVPAPVHRRRRRCEDPAQHPRRHRPRPPEGSRTTARPTPSGTSPATPDLRSSAHGDADEGGFHRADPGGEDRRNCRWWAGAPQGEGGEWRSSTSMAAQAQLIVRGVPGDAYEVVESQPRLRRSCSSP